VHPASHTKKKITTASLIKCFCIQLRISTSNKGGKVLQMTAIIDALKGILSDFWVKKFYKKHK
jgi:hypothetical protein